MNIMRKKIVSVKNRKLAHVLSDEIYGSLSVYILGRNTKQSVHTNLGKRPPCCGVMWCCFIARGLQNQLAYHYPSVLYDD